MYRLFQAAAGRAKSVLLLLLAAALLAIPGLTALAAPQKPAPLTAFDGLELPLPEELRFPDILFDADSVELTEPERAKIRAAAAILARVPDRRVLVTGHTVRIGFDAAELYISTLRAQVVAAYLQELGVRTSGEILIRGYGAEQQAVDDGIVDARYLNRRARIIVLEEGVEP